MSIDKEDGADPITNWVGQRLNSAVSSAGVGEALGLKTIERLVVEFFDASGANVEFEDGEWHAQFDNPVSLTSLAIEISKLVSSKKHSP